MQWLGPETVAFLRGLAQVPQELQKALGPGQDSTSRKGRAVIVTLGWKKLNLDNQQPYLDPVRSRVMVPPEGHGGSPGRESGPARLQGKEAELRLNGDLAPYSEDVLSGVEVALGAKHLVALPNPFGKPPDIFLIKFAMPIPMVICFHLTISLSSRHYHRLAEIVHILDISTRK